MTRHRKVDFEASGSWYRGAGQALICQCLLTGRLSRCTARTTNEDMGARTLLSNACTRRTCWQVVLDPAQLQDCTIPMSHTFLQMSPFMLMPM